MPRLETDRRDWKLDAAGDLIVPIEWTSGIEGVAQDILVALRMWAGEWFRDLSAGLPLLPTEAGGVSEEAALLGQPFDELKGRAAVLKVALSVEDVVSVPELRVAFDGGERALTVDYRAITRFGDTPVERLVVTVPV